MARDGLPGTPPERPDRDRRVVLLYDDRWPPVPGVCCWRDHARAAFAAVGAPVAEVRWPGPDGAAATGGGELAVPLAGAALVVAESLEAAAAAAAGGGVPRQRLWALALPPEPLPLGAPSAYADQLVRVAPMVGGFLSDSELARESVEQALAATRPGVEIFPPLVTDRACGACTTAAGDRGTAETTDPDTAPAGAEPPPEVAQLRRWHELLERAGTGGTPAVAYSFVAARLLGPAAPWQPARRPAWQVGGGDTAAPALDGDLPEWTVAAQQRAAGRAWEAASPAPGAARRPPRTALVAGYNLKFARELAERLDARTDLSIVVDEWPTESQPTELTGKLLDGAESIFAEWIRPSSAWLAEHKRPGQFLAVRLHRYELDTRHPRHFDIDRVGAVVYIAPRFGRRIRGELGWPAEKLVYIPNFVDVDWFDRPKLPQARFALGMVGVESSRKRFDLALDLLAQVRRADPRFTLRVRSVLPWDNHGFWRRPEEREYAGWCLERIRRDPLLRDGVVFDPPGRDMARWYRQVGHILSTSDDEGSHLAPAEGMASGAVPVIRPWPGAVEIYGIEWIHASTGDAAAAVLASADAEVWSRQAERARAEVRRSHDPAAVLAAWADLLHGDVPAARAHFAAYAAPQVGW